MLVERACFLAQTPVSFAGWRRGKGKSWLRSEQSDPATMRLPEAEHTREFVAIRQVEFLRGFERVSAERPIPNLPRAAVPS